jgi:Tfp pilus assembly protein PilF
MMSHLALFMIHAHTPLAPDPVARSEARDHLLEWATAALKSGSVFERFCAMSVQNLEKKDFAKADDNLRTVSPAGRGQFFHHLLLASVALEGGNARAAESELTFALKLEPVSLEALYLRAVARAKTDNLAGAMEDAKLAVEVSPDSKELLACVHLLKAHLHHELNELDPAGASLRAALSVAPPRVAIVANRVAAQWARSK